MNMTGSFRKALNNAGFKTQWAMLFNDKRKGFRRLKLWNARGVFNAPQVQQRALERELRAAFGDSILKMQFIEDSMHDLGSLCIYLKL